MTTDVTLKKIRLSVSNAVHSLTVLVAKEEGLFEEQGLDVELVKTAGAAQVGTPNKMCEMPSLIARWSLYTTPVEWTSSDFVNGVL